MNLSLDDEYDEQLEINKDEYIKSLEISIQLLQREIESLRKKLLEYSTNEINSQDNTNFDFDLNDLINKSNSKNELFDVLNNILNKSKIILEWQLFKINHDDSFEPFNSNITNEKIVSEINSLVEDGIADWILSNDEIKFAPSLIDSTEQRQIINIFVPITSKGSQSILFFGKTNQQIDDLTDDFKISLKQLINSISLKLDNIISYEQISEISKQLESNSSAKKNSNSTLLNIALSELSQPIEIIDANLDFMDKGIGDFSRRKDIIKENLKYIKDLKNRLVQINSDNNNTISEFNLIAIINEISFITKNQLQRDGIFLKSESKQDIIIKGDKKDIETIFTYLILFSADIMPDGGNLFLNFEEKKSKVYAKFYYENALITSDEFKRLLNNENVDNFNQNSVNLLKKIVSLCKKNNILLELIENKKIGTTFLLNLENENKK